MTRTVAAALVLAMIAGTCFAIIWPREQPRTAPVPSYSGVYDPR